MWSVGFHEEGKRRLGVPPVEALGAFSEKMARREGIGREQAEL